MLITIMLFPKINNISEIMKTIIPSMNIFSLLFILSESIPAGNDIKLLPSWYIIIHIGATFGGNPIFSTIYKITIDSDTFEIIYVQATNINIQYSMPNDLMSDGFLIFDKGCD